MSTNTTTSGKRPSVPNDTETVIVKGRDTAVELPRDVANATDQELCLLIQKYANAARLEDQERQQAREERAAVWGEFDKLIDNGTLIAKWRQSCVAEQVLDGEKPTIELRLNPYALCKAMGYDGSHFAEKYPRVFTAGKKSKTPPEVHLGRLFVSFMKAAIKTMAAKCPGKYKVGGDTFNPSNKYHVIGVLRALCAKHNTSDQLMRVQAIDADRDAILTKFWDMV